MSQECEAAGHSVSIDRKQRELYAAAHLTSSFLISTEFHHQKLYLPYLGGVFQTQLSQSRISLAGHLIMQNKFSHSLTAPVELNSSTVQKSKASPSTKANLFIVLSREIKKKVT